MTQRDAPITKNHILTNQKIYMLNIEIFSLETDMKINFFKIGAHNWLKMHNRTERDAMTQRDALIVIIEFFSLKMEVKKNFLKIGK